MNELLALIGIVVLAGSGVLAAIVRGATTAGDRLFAALVLLGSSCGLVASGLALAGIDTGPLTRAWSVPGGMLAVHVDPLSAMFLAQICVIGALCAIYGLRYWAAPENPRTSVRLRAFYGLMMAGMALLVIARNGILFLVGWEIMAIAAFFTITADDNEGPVREAGFVYLIATRVGTLGVFATFAVLRSISGSFSLSLEGLDGAAPLATAAFLLGVAGFGLKAGLMPLHVWLPGAHANAPSHVSALMSGVLIKMGIYGLLRLCSFFEAIPVWWGLFLFALGVLSAILGVAFAIAQHDLKRLLAYHSVENIGIIVMGLGIALLGQATGHKPLMVLGLAGALLHVWNHGLFKALLFLSAGSVIRATHTRDIDALGGLIKRLPWTSWAFLLGAVAICGLPPLNGFVSEWFVYLAMLRAGSLPMGTAGVAAALGVPVLALVGALAVACFVKVFGVVFLGEPRESRARAALESPRTMLWPMAVLGACCITIGALPILVVPILQNALSAWGGTGTETLGSLAAVKPLAWTNGLLALGVLLTALLLARLSRRAPATAPTWDCGYAQVSPTMQYSASSFAERVVGIFASALRPRVETADLSGPFPQPSRFHTHVPEVVLDLVVLPITRRIDRFASQFHWIQHGRVNLYLLYVVAALVVMLFIWR